MSEIKSMNYDENKLRIDELLKEHQELEGRDLYQNNTEISYASYVDDKYVGGIVGRQVDQWIHLERLAVNEKYREKGIGVKLLMQMIEYAKANKCLTITLTTLDFQAKDFYLKYGFEVFGELANVPIVNTTKYYMLYHVALND